MSHVPVTTAPFSYADSGTPSGYVCGCGASGVRLYREYQTFLNHQVLRCRRCAREQYTAAELKRWAAYKHPNDQEHCIGSLVAAVPTEEGDTYWGYTSVPQAGVEWWNRLPKARS